MDKAAITQFDFQVRGGGGSVIWGNLALTHECVRKVWQWFQMPDLEPWRRPGGRPSHSVLGPALHMYTVRLSGE